MGWNELKEELKVRFAAAFKVRDRGDLTSARQLFLKLAEEDVQSTSIYAVLGHICWDMGHLDEAVSAFSHAVKLSPKLEAVSLGLFHTLWKLEKRVEALEEAERFQAIADSKDYREIIHEINEKW